MGGHGHQGDEVPEGVRVLQVSDRVPLLGVDEVREEDRIPGVDDVDYDVRYALYLMKKMGVLFPTMSQLPSSV